MLSKVIAVGSKVELRAAAGSGRDEMEQPIYHSMVYDILSEDTLELTMPMERSKLVLLPVDGEYDIVFYGETGLYQCYARIVDRYKSDNVFILVAELISDLSKYQRREYFRFSCAMDIFFIVLQEDEIRVVETGLPYTPEPEAVMKRGIIVDISGGGLRYVSEQRCEPGSYIFCCFDLLRGDKTKKYELVGKVLSVRELEDKRGASEHRIQYYNLDVTTREEIIKFIFEEERKNRKKEKLM